MPILRSESSAPQPSIDPAPTASAAWLTRWLPVVLAVTCFVVMCALVLSQAEKMIEPDPYAYRASIAALENGDVTLTQAQYEQLTAQLQRTSLGGGISQWHQNADGSWVSEKNPGYPYLAVAFDEVGAMRFGPLFYGALACLGLWLGGRRWLGRWGGTFAVGAYCSSAVVMVMAWRSFMPTFTDASLVACGLGLLVWATLALDRSRTVRVLVGASAFLSLGLAVFVRYTNVAVLAIAAVFAVCVCLRPRWRLGWSALVWWAVAALAPLLAALAYDAAVFDGPFSTGYRSTDVQFTLDSIPKNLRSMPSHLWQAMPVFVIGLAAVVGIAVLQVAGLLHRRGTTPTEGAPPAEVPRPVHEAEVPRLVADRWIGLFLLGAWAAIWGVYAAYQWTARFGGSGALGGGPGGPGGGPGGLGGGLTYTIVRFYVPALGAVALLAAWLIMRLPKVLGVVVIAGLFVAGGVGFTSTVHSQWATSFGGGGFPGGGGPGGPGGTGGPAGRAPDLANCPNPPPPVPGAQGGGAGPDAPGGFDPSAAGPPGGITFDEHGCPVLPSTTTTPAAPGG
ncbi:MAG TPA: hypothetical protein VIJ47_03670 [Acidimicrobiales bacterium]